MTLTFILLEREAMWIRFDSADQFAIKISVGGVNAISGEPLVETSATQLRRLNRMSEEKSVQDYVVTPKQLWLDGIANSGGLVRQFFAMPMGAGYTVEAQVTGEDVAGGLQFGITPIKSSDPQHSVETVFIKITTGKLITFSGLSSWTRLSHVKELIRDKEGVPLREQRLIHAGAQLDDRKRIARLLSNVFLISYRSHTFSVENSGCKAVLIQDNVEPSH